MTPTTRSRGTVSASSRDMPQRPMPVSTLRCTASPSGASGDVSATSSRASRATASSQRASGLMTTMRAEGKASRSSSPSRTVATQSAVAPPASAAREAPTAP